jgi:thiamine biosynthesis lipoprotein
MQYDEFRAMNSNIVLAAEGTPERVDSGFQLAHQFVDESEQRFTRFTSTSELAHLNRMAGRWFEASTDFYEVVRLAQVLFNQTRGLFDPSVLPALQRAGYDRSMDEIRRFGPGEAYDLDELDRPDFRLLNLDPENRRIWIPPDMQIDLGGIAKGWIAEQAALRLAEYSTACTVSAGGDLFMIGLPEGETAWPVGLEDPGDPDQDIALLRVGPGAIATSSIAKRRWLQDERPQHHLIDPRTDQPAETDWLSVTVFAEHAAEAEVYAKALLIAGPAGGGDLSINGQDIHFIAVDQDGHFLGNNNLLEVSNVRFERVSSMEKQSS